MIRLWDNVPAKEDRKKKRFKRKIEKTFGIKLNHNQGFKATTGFPGEKSKVF
jgi:hypothetical protein